jgi:hypothetical protein
MSNNPPVALNVSVAKAVPLRDLVLTWERGGRMEGLFYRPGKGLLADSFWVATIILVGGPREVRERMGVATVLDAAGSFRWFVEMNRQRCGSFESGPRWVQWLSRLEKEAGFVLPPQVRRNVNRGV